MTNLAERLNPHDAPWVKWDYKNIDEVIPEEVHATTKVFDSLPYAILVRGLRERVRRDPKNGIAYAYLGDRGDSVDATIAHINPFGNDFGRGLDANMLIRSEYLRRAFRNLGITDESGNYLPVITMAAPSHNSTIKLKSHQYRQVAERGFGQIAAEYLHVARESNQRRIGKVAFIGFSLGASVSASAAQMARFEGLDATHIVAGEPPNVVARPTAELRKGFRQQLKNLPDYYFDGGVQHIVEAHELHESMVRQNLGAARRARINLALGKAMALNTFGDDLLGCSQAGVLSTVGSGTESLVSPPFGINATVVGTQRSSENAYRLVRGISVNGADHNWGDHIPLLATFYGYGLSRPASGSAA